MEAFLEQMYENFVEMYENFMSVLERCPHDALLLLVLLHFSSVPEHA